ncbi:MAG: hypothetical protein N2044_12350, partial [Cyclobacteriaceae bacterium]|nr:hypothetical protein [Cyclobacteriaceae bacterium]
MNVLFALVVLAAIVQFIFIFFLARGLSRAVRRQPEIPVDPPPVSVLICARNEEHKLRNLLPLILAQQYPHFEVVVV